jgi:surface protein
MYSNNAATAIDIIDLDYSNCTTIEKMFENCTGITTIDMSKIQIDSVNNMNYLFNNCTSLTSITFPDFSNVTAGININYLFNNCTSLTTIDFSNIDMYRFTNRDYMFNNCVSLKSVNFNSLNTNTYAMFRVKGMFDGCTNLTDILNLDLTKWNTTGNSSLTMPASLVNFTFKNNTVFAANSTTSTVTINCTACSNLNIDNLLNSLGTNSTGKTRKIRLHSTVYNALTDEQKTTASNKKITLGT